MTELSEAYIQPTVLNRTQTKELMSKYWPADPPMPTDTTHFGNGDTVVINQSWPGEAFIVQAKRHFQTGEMTNPMKLRLENIAKGEGMSSVKSRHALVCCGSRGTDSVLAEEVYFTEDIDGDRQDGDGGKKDALPSIIFKTEHGIYTVWPEAEKTNFEMQDVCREEAKKLFRAPDINNYEWTKADRVKYHRIRKDWGEDTEGASSHASRNL
jgi:hypothetical protein